MSEPFTTQCPHCESQMRIKNANIIGKKAPCPKCGERFVVEPMDETPPDDEFDFGGSSDDYGEDDYDSNDDSTYRSSSTGKKEKSSKTKSKKRRKKSNSDASALMVKGLGILAAVVVAAAGIFAITRIGGAARGPSPEMAWLPNDTQALFQIRVADLMASPVVKKITQEPAVAKAMQEAAAGSGVDLSNIDRVAVGFTDLSSAMQPGGGNGSVKFSGVITLKAPMNSASWVETMKAKAGTTLTTQDYSGRQLHLTQAGPASFGFCFIDDKTMVFGEESVMKQTLDAGGTCAAASRFHFGDSNEQVLIVVAPSDAGFFDQGGAMLPVTGPFGGQSQKRPSELFSGGYASLSCGSDITTGIGMMLKDSSMARNTAREMQKDARAQGTEMAKMRKEMGGGFNPMTMMLGPSADKLMGHVEAALKGASGNSSGGLCYVTLTFDGDIIDDSKSLITMAMAAGAMNGLPGGPPGFGASPFGGSPPPGGPGSPPFGPPGSIDPSGGNPPEN